MGHSGAVSVTLRFSIHGKQSREETLKFCSLQWMESYLTPFIQDFLPQFPFLEYSVGQRTGSE